MALKLSLFKGAQDREPDLTYRESKNYHTESVQEPGFRMGFFPYRDFHCQSRVNASLHPIIPELIEAVTEFWKDLLTTEAERSHRAPFN
jgi:hypothetical protein